MKKDSQDFEFHKYKYDKEYLLQLEILINKFEDTLSKKYFTIIKESIEEGKALKKIRELWYDEDQYFLRCLVSKLDNINFIDAGAYTGDTLCKLEEKKIRPREIWCFEANHENFIRLKGFKPSINRGENIHFENIALWDCNMRIGMKYSNYNARIDEDSKEKSVKTIMIDEYFKNIKVGFIKMDIEGAEQKALLGGVKTLKRDRSILAISIYHSLDGIVRIPTFLMNELKNYYFLYVTILIHIRKLFYMEFLKKDIILMKMKKIYNNATKILVWGIGKGFWDLYNILKINEEIGNFEIVGYISKNLERGYIDKRKVLSYKDLKTYPIDFDYIIVTSDKYYKEIIEYGSKKLYIEQKNL